MWYIEKAHETLQPDFFLHSEKVEPDLDKAFALCKKLEKGQHLQVVWIVDVEHVVNYNQNLGLSRGETLAALHTIFEEMQSHPKVLLVINNPTFEVWLQLHFEQLSRSLELTGETVCRRLQTYLPDYSREASFYHATESIFMKTQQNLQTASIHATSLVDPDFPELRYARTSMSKVINLLQPQNDGQ